LRITAVAGGIDALGDTAVGSATFDAAGTGCPQVVQNTAPSPNFAPHFEQNIFLQSVRLLN
jgi:hypothetical protein